MKTLFILAVLLCMSIAFALKCNFCASSESMDKCKSTEQLQDCPSTADRCYKWSQEYKNGALQVKTFGKGCSTQQLCDQTLSACKAFSEAKCEVDCCDSDGCNGSTVPVISIFLLATCALMALFRF